MRILNHLQPRLYDVVEILLPYLPLSETPRLFEKIIEPVRALTSLPEKRVQMETSLARWFSKANDKESALQCYGMATRFSNLDHKLCKEASLLLTEPLFDLLPELSLAIDRAIEENERTTLESLLESLSSIRNHFCLTPNQREKLVPLYQKLVPFFSRLSPPSPLASLIMEGLTIDQGSYPSPYAKTCLEDLSHWQIAFASETLILLPNLLKKLSQDTGPSMKLLLAYLGHPSSEVTSSPLFFTPQTLFTLFWQMEKAYPSLIEFAFLRAAFCDDSEEIPSLSSMVKEAVTYLVYRDSPIDLHEKFYRALSTKPLLEPLRTVYISFLPFGAIFDRLASIPNREGLRFSTRLEQEKLNRQIDLITQADPSPVTVKGPFGTRYLIPSLISHLFDEEGNIKKHYRDSLHRVCRIQQPGVDLHLKQKPSAPMMEFAVYDLCARLNGRGVPPSELLRFEVNLPGISPKLYPVLASQTVSGTNLKEVSVPQFDTDQLTEMLLFNLLIRPGDGRASNFILTPEGHVVSIDNEASIVEPVVKGFFGQIVNFYSILFCFDRRPLSQKVLNEWSQLSPDLIFDAWIEEIARREEKYCTLFTEAERRELYQEDETLKFTPQLLLKKGTITTLYTQLHLLRQLANKPPKDSLDLLNHLITISDSRGTSHIGPRLYKAYNISSGGSPSEKLKKATGNRRRGSVSSSQYYKMSLDTVPTIEEIERRELFSLERIREEFLTYTFFQIEGIKFQGQRGKEALRADFSHIMKDGYPDIERQKMILKGLSLLVQSSLPSSIALTNCAALTSENLVDFLHSGLTILDIRCSNLYVIPRKIQQCPLEELYLSGSSNLTGFPGYILFDFEPKRGVDLSVQLPKLKVLHMTQCLALSDLLLFAPSIQDFRVDSSLSKKLIFNREYCYYECFLPPLSERPLLSPSTPSYSFGVGS